MNTISVAIPRFAKTQSCFFFFHYLLGSFSKRSVFLCYFIWSTHLELIWQCSLPSPEHQEVLTYKRQPSVPVSMMKLMRTGFSPPNKTADARSPQEKVFIQLMFPSQICAFLLSAGSLRSFYACIAEQVLLLWLVWSHPLQTSAENDVN